jgi:excisionase family DNA binding protein
MDDEARPIGLSEAAKLLGVSHATLRAQIWRGRLNADKVGRDWLVTGAEIRRYRSEVQEPRRRSRGGLPEASGPAPGAKRRVVGQSGLGRSDT